MDVQLKRHWALFYDYVTENLLELRVPHRLGHIGLLRDWTADGRILQGGVLGDPPHGALFVFDVEDRATVEEFVAQDPYVAAGLVTAHRIEPWNVVV